MTYEFEDDYPTVTCPSCGHVEPDMDGFGFLYCGKCGHCKHPSSTMVGDKWVCGVCTCVVSIVE